jgi:hypothetical protein
MGSESYLPIILMSKVARTLNQITGHSAVVVEELMKDDDVDVVLSGFINFLEQKEMEGNGIKDVGDENEIILCRSKKIKIEDEDDENKIPLKEDGDQRRWRSKMKMNIDGKQRADY